MNRSTIGDELLRLLRSAKEDVLLVAPFMKIGAATKAVKVLGSSVSVRCYTRWRPEEVAAGVSDLEVADLMERQGSGTLYLVADLHGKLYCSETSCLVTSANLTDAALGWRSPANLEFAVLLPRDDPSIVSFEVALERFAVEATPEIRALVEAASAGVSARIVGRSSSRYLEDASGRSVSLASWAPTCLVPSRLYDLYRGWDVQVSSEAAADGFRDLEVLGLPVGFAEETFNRSIQSLLLQHPRLSIVIHRAMEESITCEAVERHLQDLLGPHLETTAEAFRISASWIAYFFRDSIELRWEMGSEVLSPVAE